MFSHTAKGQAYNMPLLARFVASSKASDLSKKHFPRLIDYELLTDENGKRTVGFGWFAGVAGVLESLAAMAHHHLESGIASPFLVRPFLLYLHVLLKFTLHGFPAHPSPVHVTYHRKAPRIIALHRVFDFTIRHTTRTRPVCDWFDWVRFHFPMVFFFFR
jgi:hypothetical protein